MGCDIHAVFQAKKNGQWQDIESRFEQNRHYFLFAWLAGVRNGFGFAGVPTHDPIKPIADPRGYPADFQVNNDDHGSEVNKYGDVGKWMGDHSHSWLTAAEILAAPLPINGTMRTGVISREQFNKWDGHSQPEEWSGGITGPGIVVAASPAVIGPRTTHVTIEWPMPTDALDYFIEEVRRLQNEHGEVRMIFGFDS